VSVTGEASRAPGNACQRTGACLEQAQSLVLPCQAPAPGQSHAGHPAPRIHRGEGQAGDPPRRAAPGRTPTYDGEHLLLDVSPDVYPSPALGVVRPAEAGDVHHAALVHVHHAGCGRRERKGRSAPSAEARGAFRGLGAENLSSF